MRALLNFLLRMTPWFVRRRIKNVPGLAQAQRVLVAAAFNGKEFVHEVDAGPAKGVRFLIRMPDDKTIWTGAYEAAFARKVADSIRAGSVAFDIGGWHGFFAGVMAAQGARVVHVFEPLPENAERIAKLIELNPNLDIRLHALALSDTDGNGELTVMPDSSMAKLSNSQFQSDRSSERRIGIALRRLDTLLAEGLIDRPDVIKIDVEGAEAFVLKGALELIRQSQPVIFAEIHSPVLLAECAEILQELGYRIDRLETDLGPARKPDGSQILARPA